MVIALHCQVISEAEWLTLRDGLGLSSRQADIIRRILGGASDKQIAGDLEIAVPTVRTHLSRVFRRFDLNDRVELLLYVLARIRGNQPESRECEGGDRLAEAR